MSSSPIRRTSRTLLSLAAVAALAPCLFAQSVEAPPPVRTLVIGGGWTVSHRGEIGMALRLDAAAGPYVTVGAVGSIGALPNYSESDDDGEVPPGVPEAWARATIMGEVRVWPDGRPFRGFSIGGGLGASRVGVSCDGCIGDTRDRTLGRASLDVGYNWLLTPSRRLALWVRGGAVANGRPPAGSRLDVQRVEGLAHVGIGFAF
jgi:hypothetical protein